MANPLKVKARSRGYAQKDPNGMLGNELIERGETFFIANESKFSHKWMKPLGWTPKTKSPAGRKDTKLISEDNSEIARLIRNMDARLTIAEDRANAAESRADEAEALLKVADADGEADGEGEGEGNASLDAALAADEAEDKAAQELADEEAARVAALSPPEDKQSGDGDNKDE